MKTLHRTIVTLLAISFFSNAAFSKTTWQEVSPGLSYARIAVPTLTTVGSIHAFRVDLKLFNLSLALAKDYDGVFSSAQNLMLATKGVVGINGGFFTPEMDSLGLRVSNGELLSRFKNSPWWGVFLIENNQAKIVSASQFKQNSNIKFAVQSGPRLVVDGKLPKLRPGVANRSALGILRDGQILIIATQNLYLSTTELANILRRSAAEEGLECWQAINLDGGSSTQLYAKVKDFELSVPSFMPVADVVVVMPKS